MEVTSEDGEREQSIKKETRYAYDNEYIDKDDVRFTISRLYPIVNRRVHEICAEIEIVQYLWSLKRLYMCVMDKNLKLARTYGCRMCSRFITTTKGRIQIELTAKALGTQREHVHNIYLNCPTHAELERRMQDEFPPLFDAARALPCEQCGDNAFRHQLTCKVARANLNLIPLPSLLGIKKRR